MSYTVQRELKGHIAKPVPWWVVILILLIAATFLFCLALYIGHRLGYAMGKEQGVVLVKANPAPEKPPLRWQCNASELREYRNICLKRKAT